MCGPAGSICICSCICILLVRVHAFQLCLQPPSVERGGDTLHPTNRHPEPVTQDDQYCRLSFYSDFVCAGNFFSLLVATME